MILLCPRAKAVFLFFFFLLINCICWFSLACWKCFPRKAFPKSPLATWVLFWHSTGTAPGFRSYAVGKLHFLMKVMAILPHIVISKILQLWKKKKMFSLSPEDNCTFFRSTSERLFQSAFWKLAEAAKWGNYRLPTLSCVGNGTPSGFPTFQMLPTFRHPF